MKKLAVFMIIPALAMFMVPAMVSANWYYWWGIQGTWEMSASGSCLHSSNNYVPGINGRWTAPPGSDVYAGVTVSNGTWNFKTHGEGTYSQRIYATILPGGADSMNGIPVPLEVRVLPPLSVEPTPVAFTYEITPAGDITVTETVSGIKHYGNISKDMNTMTLLSANNVQVFGGNFLYTICNTARTLIKVQELSYRPTGLR
jgi:hypothetical protein